MKGKEVIDGNNEVSDGQNYTWKSRIDASLQRIELIHSKKIFESLIEESVSKHNLSRMFQGWTSWI